MGRVKLRDITCLAQSFIVFSGQRRVQSQAASFEGHGLHCDAINITKENNLNSTESKDDHREQREFLEKSTKCVHGAAVVIINEAWQKHPEQVNLRKN